MKMPLPPRKSFFRWRRRYALLPTRVGNELIWLEGYWVRKCPSPFEIERTTNPKRAEIPGEDIARLELLS